MHRRLLLAALACCQAMPIAAQVDAGRPRHKIGAAQLHGALAARFPVRFALGPLLTLQVSAPRLLLVPARDKLGATLNAHVGGVQLQGIAPGEVDLVFALRYERSDRTVRAHQPELLDLRWHGMAPDALQQLRSSLQALAREAVGEVVLHTFQPADLALADVMGFEPHALTVEQDGLVIGFGPKPRG